MKENNTTTDATRAAQATTHRPLAAQAPTDALKTPIEPQQPQPPQPLQPLEPPWPPMPTIPDEHWKLIHEVTGDKARDLIRSIEEGVPNRPRDSACNEVRCLLYAI